MVDDYEETAFTIPYSGEDDEEIGLPSTDSIPNDTPELDQLRMRAYKQAWDKCLERIQNTVQQLLRPHVEKVVQQLLDEDTVPGLPHPELPVVSISNPIFGTSFLNDVCARLDIPSVHLRPSDCTSIASAMRALVTGLVGEPDLEFRVKYKNTTSLAAFDINYLLAWYKQLDEDPTLLVVLHNFEEFDPTVMQDVFYICSRQLPQLPLSFILSLSTPLPTYLHMVYPRSTLSHLRIRDVTIPNGMTVLNEILTQTFFSLDFTPDIIPGPTSLEYVADFFSRHNRTLDSLITNLQLVHMKHFSVEPLACLVDPASSPPSPSVLEAAFARILAVEPKFDPTHNTRKKGHTTVDVLLEKVHECRVTLLKTYHKLKLSFELMKRIHIFCVTYSVNTKGLGWDIEKGVTEIFEQFLRGKGRVQLWMKEMLRIVRLLKPEQLEFLFDELSTFYEEHIVYSEHGPTWDKFVDVAYNEEDPPDFAECREDAKLCADYLDFFMSDCLERRIEDQPLWEIWYTGNTPFPSELINPSVRASILAGLLRPLEFTSISTDSGALLRDSNNDESLWKLPDTSILFRRYLDSGKLINVYDWFEAFQAVLDTQKEELKKKREGGTGRKRKAYKGTPSPKKRASASPKKQSAKAKGKQRQQQDAEREEIEVDADGEEEEGKDAEEQWKLEVHARFIRALHELDYLGFIKHTRRRADHVTRTVFEVNE